MSLVTLTVRATGRTVVFQAVGEPAQFPPAAPRITETERPGRPSATRPDGYAARRITVPGFLDAFPAGSVEPGIQALTLLAHPGPTTSPPVVTIHGDTVPPQAALVGFYVAAVEWGEPIRRSDGARSRQPFTLELVEAVEAAVKVTVRKVQKYRWATPLKGETIQGLARRVLKDARRANVVIGLNKPWAQKPGQVIPAGKKVRVPA